MTLFLTGATSYLGSYLTEHYGDRYSFCGVSRSDPTAPCDLTDAAAVATRFAQAAPDAVLHLAADLGRDAATSAHIRETNPAITRTLVSLAQERGIPFIFTSTEAVYGGRGDGGYPEDGPFLPRSPYGESKLMSEDIVRAAGIPHLITRAHRYVGRNPNYTRPKQFPDTMRTLLSGEAVHLDAVKRFTPVHLSHLCAVFDHFLTHARDAALTLNVGVERSVTFHELVSDIVQGLEVDPNPILPDGEEAGWPADSSVDTRALAEHGFPAMTYDELVGSVVEEYSRA